MRNKSTFILLLLVFVPGIPRTEASQVKTDSLWNIWSNPKQNVNVRLTAMERIIKERYLLTQPDSAVHYARLILKLAEKHKIKDKEGQGHYIIGTALAMQGRLREAKEQFELSLEAFRQAKQSKPMAEAHNSIGDILQKQGELTRAAEQYTKSLKANQLDTDSLILIKTLQNFGSLFYAQGAYDKALTYFQNSLNIAQRINEKDQMAANLVNLGNIYYAQERDSEALLAYQEFLRLSEERNNLHGIAYALNNIGMLYQVSAQFDKAITFYTRSIAIREQMGDKLGQSRIFYDLAMIRLDQQNWQEAIVLGNKALELAEETGEISSIRNATEILWKAGKGSGNLSLALSNYERYILIRDSITDLETQRNVMQQRLDYEYEMKENLLKAEQYKKDAITKEKIKRKNQQRNAWFAGFSLMLAIAGISYRSYRQKRRDHEIISKEKDRSDQLLLNILPAEIAQELKVKGHADARDFELVSILFTDFKEFTQTSEKLSAKELVAEINICFEAFDAIMELYGIEKIKTIGDAYMAAGGLPIPTNDSVKNTVLAALKMQDFITRRKQEMEALNLPAFEMRVGIHTGPVVAGIVGVKKFQYDIWGDTVNTAARMESAGEVGKVNISEATFKLINDDPDFAFENRGMIEAKGKGKIEMWFVTLKQYRPK